LGNRLDLTLEDQETLVVEIDASVAEKRGDSGKVGFLAIDVVLARVVPECLSRDDEARVGNDFGGKPGLRASDHINNAKDDQTIYLPYP
jgi:hypothetical protein